MRVLLRAVIALLALGGGAAAQDFDIHLDEVRRLIDEKSYVTALEDLKFIAQQIQELRLAETLPLFPAPPEGWAADQPVRTSMESELWSRRLQVQRKYLPVEGGGKVEYLFDFYSPFIPEVGLSLNPVVVAGDPRAEIVEVRGFRGRLWFNADTGEGELVFVLGSRVLVSVSGRGIPSKGTLREFALLLDMEKLSSWTPP